MLVEEAISPCLQSHSGKQSVCVWLCVHVCIRECLPLQMRLCRKRSMIAFVVQTRMIGEHLHTWVISDRLAREAAADDS